MLQPFSAAPHHDILVLLIQVAVLLLTARLFAEIAQRLGQPSVVGELLAGIVLGPSCLSTLFPFIGVWLVPHTPTQGHLLELVSFIGALFLLLITGLETDLPLIRRHARNALGTALGGLILPFACGFLLSYAIPAELLIDPDNRLVFALFLATTMSLSAIPVIAKVLIDLQLIRRDIGQTIIAAGMVDDTVAWIILSVVLGLASGSAITLSSIALSISKVLLFISLSFFIGRWLVKQATTFTQDKIKSRDKMLSLIVILMFTGGAIAQTIHLEAVLGAFMVGVLFAQIPNLSKEVIEKIESIAFGVFAPIFFATAGLKVNMFNLAHPTLFTTAIIMILIATFSKVVGAYVGARLLGNSDHWTALSFGAGLNARGAIQIIVATIGLSLGILTQDMFSMIVLMAVTTSLIAPIALRWTLRHVVPKSEEIARLNQEKLLKDNLIARLHRVLLPVRRRQDNSGSPTHLMEAMLLKRFSQKNNLAITLYTLAPEADKTESLHFLNTLGQIFPQQNLTKKVGDSSKLVKNILEEASKNYDLMILGATEQEKGLGQLFTPLVDDLVRLSPCPSLVVHGHGIPTDWQPKRILVPTNGSTAARRAAEVAFALATSPAEQVQLLKVIEEKPTDYRFKLDEASRERQIVISHEIVEELRLVGESLGVRTYASVKIGPDPETIILNLAQKNEVDLIILGTDIRPGSDKLYLGPRVERILHNAPCPVIVVNSI